MGFAIILSATAFLISVMNFIEIHKIKKGRK